MKVLWDDSTVQKTKYKQTQAIIQRPGFAVIKCRAGEREAERDREKERARDVSENHTELGGETIGRDRGERERAGGREEGREERNKESIGRRLRIKDRRARAEICGRERGTTTEGGQKGR